AAAGPLDPIAVQLADKIQAEGIAQRMQHARERDLLPGGVIQLGPGGIHLYGLNRTTDRPASVQPVFFASCSAMNFLRVGSCGVQAFASFRSSSRPAIWSMIRSETSCQAWRSFSRPSYSLKESSGPNRTQT